MTKNVDLFISIKRNHTSTCTTSDEPDVHAESEVRNVFFGQHTINPIDIAWIIIFGQQTLDTRQASLG